MKNLLEQLGGLYCVNTDGVGTTVTVLVHELAHPSRVTLSVSVKVPPVNAVTVTDAPVVDPTMDPCPLMDQLCVTDTPFAGNTVEV